MLFSLHIADAAFVLALCFLAGILGAILGLNAAVLFCLALGSIGIVCLFSKFAFSTGFYATITGAAFCLSGAFYYHFFLNMRLHETNMPFGKQVSFPVVIENDPTQSSQFDIFSAKLMYPFSGDVTMITPLGVDFHYGEEVEVTGEIEPPDQPYGAPVIFPKKIALVAEHKGFWLREKLLDFKAAILKKFEEALPSDQAGLLVGETLGGTNGMSSGLKNEMSDSGTSYVTSMYGYKIGAIAFAIMDGLGVLIPRRGRFFLALVAVILFIFMAGAETTVIRGAVMAVLLLVVREAGMKFNIRNALTFTALGMVIFDPTILIQPAFQLSFLSVLGIVYLASPLKKVFRWRSPDDAGVFRWREGTVSACAALLPIIPVIANQSGGFSLIFFLSNALIFPAIPIAMFCGVILAAVSFTGNVLAFFVAKIIQVVLLYQLGVIKFFSIFAVPMPIAFDSAIIVAIYYGGLILFIDRYAE